MWLNVCLIVARVKAQSVRWLGPYLRLIWQLDFESEALSLKMCRLHLEWNGWLRRIEVIKAMWHYRYAQVGHEAGRKLPFKGFVPV